MQLIWVTLSKYSTNDFTYFDRRISVMVERGFFQTKLQIRQFWLGFFFFQTIYIYVYTVYLKDSFKSICTIKLLTAKRQSHRSSKMPNRPTRGSPLFLCKLGLYFSSTFFNKCQYRKKNRNASHFSDWISYSLYCFTYTYRIGLWDSVWHKQTNTYSSSLIDPKKEEIENSKADFRLSHIKYNSLK